MYVKSDKMTEIRLKDFWIPAWDYYRWNTLWQCLFYYLIKRVTLHMLQVKYFFRYKICVFHPVVNRNQLAPFLVCIIHLQINNLLLDLGWKLNIFHNESGINSKKLDDSSVNLGYFGHYKWTSKKLKVIGSER